MNWASKTRIWLTPFAVALFVASSTNAGFAQVDPDQIHAEWSIGKAPQGEWTVGDQIPLYLNVTYPKDFDVVSAELPSAWGPFEVHEQTPIEFTTVADDMATATLEAKVILWVPGEYQTPPVPIGYRDASGAFGETTALPLTISVASVLREGDNQKRDLKPQAWLPRPSVLPWVSGGVLLAIITAVLIWYGADRYQNQKKSTASPSPVKDLRPPHEIAYAELDRIEALDLPAQGAIKQHFALVSDCLRRYVHGRYGIPATDQTSEETMVAIGKVVIPDDGAAALRDFLATADLVKFAKFRPVLEQANGAVSQARYIVDITQPDSLNDQQSVPTAKSPPTGSLQSDE